MTFHWLLSSLSSSSYCNIADPIKTLQELILPSVLTICEYKEYERMKREGSNRKKAITIYRYLLKLYCAVKRN
jgi:hypothetical protein